MKKPKAVPAAPALSDYESMMLRHLLELKEQASQNVAKFIGFALTNRQLPVTDWAVSLADYKSILAIEKPNQPAQS